MDILGVESGVCDFSLKIYISNSFLLVMCIITKVKIAFGLTIYFAVQSIFFLLWIPFHFGFIVELISKVIGMACIYLCLRSLLDCGRDFLSGH